MKIEFRNITCGYSKKPVIKDLSFCVESGEALCVLGKNGIGKTTLLKTLLRQLPIISGEIIINEKSINDYSVHEMSQIMSYIPQSRDYSYNYDAIDVVLMGKVNQLGFFSAPSVDDRSQALEVMKQLGIDNFAFENYSHLSGGEQQMVLMARSIIQDARFILMDEPAANLDFFNQKKLIDAIRSLKEKGIGVIMVSHNPDHGISCCENTLMIKKDGEYAFGNTNKLITEKNLFEVFGVDMNVFEVEESDGKIYKKCSVKY